MSTVFLPCPHKAARVGVSSDAPAFFVSTARQAGKGHEMKVNQSNTESKQFQIPMVVTDEVSSSELCSPNIKHEYIIRDGDVIFSWSGSLLVDIWCGGTCGLNQHLFKVTSDTYDKWFYYLWTAYHLDRFIAIAADKATTMGHIKRGELAKAEVLIPSEEDYKKINAVMNPIFELTIANRIETRKLAELRDELLPRLMNGEIDVDGI